MKLPTNYGAIARLVRQLSKEIASRPEKFETIWDQAAFDAKKRALEKFEFGLRLIQAARTLESQKALGSKWPVDTGRKQE